jgi:hypothetical protein
MPFHLQLAAVAIISAFVVYEGWCSAALSVFSCQYIDSGLIEDPQPQYYASFQAVSEVGMEKGSQVGSWLSPVFWVVFN